MNFEWKTSKYKIDSKKLPQKRTINLAKVGQNTINKKIATPGIICIIVLACIFSKFAVVDRLVKVSNAQKEVKMIQDQVDEGNKTIESYGNLAEKYAHYTYSGFHQEELSRADRMEVVNLLRKYVYPKAYVGAWYLSENRLTLPITAGSLEEVNQVVQTLETTDLVDYCTVNTAATGDLKESKYSLNNGNERNTSIVTAEVTIYLNQSTTTSWEEGVEDESTQP